jgi:TPR repeat protein
VIKSLHSCFAAPHIQKVFARVPFSLPSGEAAKQTGTFERCRNLWLRDHVKVNKCEDSCSDFQPLWGLAMSSLRTIVLAAHYLSAALIVSTVGISNVEAQASRPLDPKAAEQYASDSEKAEHGDPDAEYRVGEALESGRLGGVVDNSKALTFYRRAAEQGHRRAAERVAEIEAILGRNEEKLQAAPSSPGQ